MEMYKQLLAKEIGQLVLQALDDEALPRAERLTELSAVAALEKIQAAVGDGSLSDFDCVEKIVRILEDAGSNGGGRHDFG